MTGHDATPPRGAMRDGAIRHLSEGGGLHHLLTIQSQLTMITPTITMSIMKMAKAVLMQRGTFHHAGITSDCRAGSATTTRPTPRQDARFVEAFRGRWRPLDHIKNE